MADCVAAGILPAVPRKLSGQPGGKSSRISNRSKMFASLSHQPSPIRAARMHALYVRQGCLTLRRRPLAATGPANGPRPARDERELA